MLSTLMILSPDQGKIYGATHPLFRDQREVVTADKADVEAMAPEAVLLRQTSGFAAFLYWLANPKLHRIFWSVHTGSE